MTTMTEQLKPCPFCKDGKPYIHFEADSDGMGEFASVKCGGCGAQSRQHFASSGNACPQFFAEVREDWNHRATAPAMPESEAVRVLREALERLINSPGDPTLAAWEYASKVLDDTATIQPAAAEDYEHEKLVKELRDFAQAYPDDIFLPITDDEREANANIITKASAGMGRYFAKWFTAAADAIEALSQPAAAAEPVGYMLPSDIKNLPVHDHATVFYSDVTNTTTGERSVPVYTAAPAQSDGWSDALSQAALYVRDHCANGEHHAEAIYGMKRGFQAAAAPAQADRDSVLEEAAKVCVDLGGGTNGAYRHACHQCKTAILDLKRTTTKGSTGGASDE